MFQFPIPIYVLRGQVEIYARDRLILDMLETEEGKLAQHEIVGYVSGCA